MRIAKLEFETRPATGDGLPVVVVVVSDSDGNAIHRHAAEYRDDPSQGVAFIMDYVAGVIREIWKDADGSPSMTWHKEAA